MIGWINKKRNQKGFTLIELVVVIAILGILAAIAIPRLSGSRANANRKSLVATLRTIDSAITIAEADSETLDTNIQTLVDKGYLAAIPSVPGATIAIVEKEIKAAVGNSGDANYKPAIRGKRAVASIVEADFNKFGIDTAVTTQTVEELQQSALWQ